MLAGVTLPGIAAFFIWLRHGVGTPDFLTSVLIVSDDRATYTVLTATETGDDEVASDSGWRSDDRTLSVVNHSRGPELFAGLRVKRSQLRVKTTKEDLAISVCNTTAVHVAASKLINVLWQLWRMTPFDITRFCVNRVDVFRTERRGHVHRVTNQNRCRFL